MKINPNFAEVGCAREGCSGDPDGVLHRHHRGHEKFWLRKFERRRGGKPYKDFKARYEEFHPDDIVRLCPECHEEVHRFLYHEVLHHIRWNTPDRPFGDYSWAEAKAIVERLRRLCDRWLKTKTLDETLDLAYEEVLQIQQERQDARKKKSRS